MSEGLLNQRIAFVLGEPIFARDDETKEDLVFRCKGDLEWANLAGCVLTGIDLSGANLRRAILFSANLAGANLCGADLRGINFITTNLTEAVFDATTKVDCRQQLLDRGAVEVPVQVQDTP